jgi:hypothetical protein
VGRYSDKFEMRGPFIMAVNVVGIVGYAILYGTSSATAGYIASFVACCGLFPNVACCISWAGSNTGGDLKRSGT